MALTGSGVLVSQQLAATETTQYTAPSTVGGNPLKLVTVKAATLYNGSGSAVTVSISLVKVGGTAGAANRVMTTTPPLAAGDSTVVGELVEQVLGPGDFISAIASAATSVAFVASGVVLS